MMRRLRQLHWVAAVLLAVACGPKAIADPPADKLPREPADGRPGSEFLRLAVDEQRKQPSALEAAIVTYVPQDCGKTSPRVDLIAAVHIADKSYYEELNRRFAGYDAVLYELVAPKGTRVTPGAARSDHPVSALQVGLTRVLDLTFQLDVIDYSKRNMIHADMSPRQLAESMEKRGESFWTILVRMMAHAMAQQDNNSVSDAQLLAALLNKNRALALKRIMAAQFRDLEGSINAVEGPKGSALVSDRNKVALAELRKAIDGKKKKIAIFYGAAHMPDLQKRLKEDFELAPTETQWLTAWNLKDRKPTPPAKPRPKAGKTPVAPRRG